MRFRRLRRCGLPCCPAPGSTPQRGTRVIDQIEHIIEATTGIGHRPLVQFRLHSQYSCPRFRCVGWPRNIRIHGCVSLTTSRSCDHTGPLRHAVGSPDLGLLRVLRPTPARSAGHALSPRHRRWRRRPRGRTGMVPTFTFEPLDGIGTQLCPSILATVTPQAFTVTSRPATSPSPGVPLTAEAMKVRDATRPASARLESVVFD